MAPKIDAVSDTQPAVLRATQITAAASTDSFLSCRASESYQMGTRIRRGQTQTVFAWRTTPLGFESGIVNGVPAPHLPKQSCRMRDTHEHNNLLFAIVKPGFDAATCRLRAQHASHACAVEWWSGVRCEQHQHAARTTPSRLIGRELKLATAAMYSTTQPLTRTTPTTHLIRCKKM